MIAFRNRFILIFDPGDAAFSNLQPERDTVTQPTVARNFSLQNKTARQNKLSTWLKENDSQEDKDI